MSEQRSTDEMINAYRDSAHTGDPSPEHLPWYVKEVQDLDPKAQELFEKYSKVPADEVAAHIKKCRDTAFKVYPYPCLGRFAFLELSISLSPKYPEILQRIKNGDKYLDIGCCVGQDIRKLASDGAPSENMYGSDLQQEFMDIGYDLFLDKSTLKSTFIAADILNPESGLKQLEGQIDIIHAASFFHLFDWDESVTAMKQAVRLLKAKPGSMLVGRQIGNAEAGARAGSRTNKQRYRHNQESFEKMWKQVGEETGTNWNVDARLSSEDLFKLGLAAGVKADFIPPDTRWLSFTVTRV